MTTYGVGQLQVPRFCEWKNISISANSISDIRQIESILCENFSKHISKSSNNSQEYHHHIHQAKEHIIEAVSNLEQNDEVEYFFWFRKASIYHLPVRKYTNHKEQT